MRRVTVLTVISFSLRFGATLAAGQSMEAVSVALRDNQYDLATDGRTFLLKEAAAASFFMLGELHGDNVTRALIRWLWPAMRHVGYRHIAAELSPWAASRLEFPTQNVTDSIQSSFS